MFHPWTEATPPAPACAAGRAGGAIGGLAERARAGRLLADEMAGGAITVSNAGMHGLSAMTSIIVPGQSMILGVGSVRELFRPDARGQPALRREIALVLSLDHRVLDGVSALRVLGAIAYPLPSRRREFFPGKCSPLPAGFRPGAPDHWPMTPPGLPPRWFR